MVRQVRKIVCLLAIIVLLGGFATTANAASYTAYDGTPSNTYIQYYRDILSGLSITDNYVVFRADQNKYIMVVGDIVYNNGLFTSDQKCTTYTMQSDGNYNSYYSYTIGSIDSLVLDVNDRIVYSDLGTYPQLEERGQSMRYLRRYCLLLCVLAMCVGLFSTTAHADTAPKYKAHIYAWNSGIGLAGQESFYDGATDSKSADSSWFTLTDVTCYLKFEITFADDSDYILLEGGKKYEFRIDNLFCI